MVFEKSTDLIELLLLWEEYKLLHDSLKDSPWEFSTIHTRDFIYEGLHSAGYLPEVSRWRAAIGHTWPLHQQSLQLLRWNIEPAVICGNHKNSFNTVQRKQPSHTFEVRPLHLPSGGSRFPSFLLMASMSKVTLSSKSITSSATVLLLIH